MLRIIKIRIYNQKKVIHRSRFQFQLISEYWSIGLRLGENSDERIDVFVFQHSSIPSLHYSKAEAFKNFWQPLNHLFTGYNHQKILGFQYNASN